MMTRLVSWLFFLSLGAAALLLVLPGFIDWTSHKDLLVSELSQRLGEDISIGGDVSLRLLPDPRLTMDTVTIGPAGDQYLLKLARLEARMSLSQLLHGRFEVEHIHLADPVINVAATPDGSNWGDFWSHLHAEGAAPAAGKSMIFLKDVSISHARLMWQMSVGAQPWELGQINLTVAASALQGPYQARGDLMYGEQPVTFTLNAGPKAANGDLPFELALQPIDDMPQATFKGLVTAQGDTRLSADVTAKDGSLGSLLAPFPDLARALANLDVLQEKGDASFTLAVAPEKILVKNLKLKTAKNATLAGEAAFPAGQPRIDMDVTMTLLDRWQSFKGALDTARGDWRGETLIKTESLSRLQAGLPDVSAEVSGQLRASGADWTVEDMSLVLPQWNRQSLTGAARHNGPATEFSLKADKLGALETVVAEGRAGDDGQAAAKLTASLQGTALAADLAGPAATPEITVDLGGVPPQKLLELLGARPDTVTLDGGSATFKGRLDLGASDAAAALAGTLTLSPAKVRLSSLDPAGLQSKLLSFDKVPDDLADQLAAALKAGTGVFNAKSLSFDLPLQNAGWQMKGLTYDGGTVDLTTDAGRAKVAIAPARDDVPAYGGALPLSAEALPVDKFADLIRARHPEPKVDTKDAIGGILDRLDADPTPDTPTPDTPPAETPAPAAADAPAVTDAATPPAGAVPPPAVVKPPADADMPPQPMPELPVIDVGPAPALPQDTPLAVDPAPVPPAAPVTAPPPVAAPDTTGSDAVPDEIFPVEKPQ